MNAISGQISIRRAKERDVYMDRDRYPLMERTRAKAAMDAYDSVEHTLGEMSARLFFEEKRAMTAKETPNA